MEETVVKFAVKETKRALDDYKKKVDNAVFMASKLTGVSISRTMKEQIKGRHKPGTKTPSRPGQPPTSISTGLKGSIISNVTRLGFQRYQIVVGPTKNYSRAVELGHPNWPSGINYPFVSPTAKIVIASGSARRVYEQALKTNLRR